MVAARIPAAAPVEIGRDAARVAAERELSKEIYHRDDPSLLERLYEWLRTTVSDALSNASEVAPGGYLGLLVLVGLVVLAVIAIRLRQGRLARTRAGRSALFAGRPASAAEHLAAADRHAAAGARAEAVRERLRAIIRQLEERDLVPARPGRTAAEAAAAGGAALPGCAAGLQDAARIFDDVWYGGRAATPAMDATLRAVDDAVRAARPTLAAQPSLTAP